MGFHQYDGSKGTNALGAVVLMDMSCALCLAAGFDPAAGVDEGIEPGGHVVAAASGRIVGALPWEDGTFGMRHHGQVAAVSRGYRGHRAARSVGIGGVCRVVILRRDVVAGE